MDALLTIGEFSKMTYLSVKALRHYHDVGLLEPVDIDRATGYRRYSTAQVSTAQAIRRFRELDMPIDHVRAVLEAPDVTSRNEAILVHLRHMQQQLERTQTTVASLQTLLEDVRRTSSVTRRSFGPTSSLAISETVGFDDVGEWCGAVFDELHGELAGAGIPPAGPDGALYFSDFFELGLGEVIAFVPITEDVGPIGRAERLDLPAADFAVLVHEGHFADLDRTYGALGTHVALQRIGVDGPIREHYVVAGDDVDPGDHRTEVCWPITVQTTT
ncbi:MAG TPA: MerR family transcriptional regulator [Ilumatobacteraceae bacterium]|nr:MerR family transcriptional regulator [Ilumatobacteraceae bacterium]